MLTSLVAYASLHLSAKLALSTLIAEYCDTTETAKTATSAPAAAQAAAHVAATTATTTTAANATSTGPAAVEHAR